MPQRRRPSSKEILHFVAPLAIAAGFAAAAHGGWLCNGASTSKIKVLAKAEPGTSIEIEANGAKIKSKTKRKAARKRARKNVSTKIGSKIYRASETHWVPRTVVQRIFADPSLLESHGELVPVSKCRGLVGYRVEDTLPRGLFRKLGFRDNDLITAIDGQRFSSLSYALDAVVDLEHDDQVTVTVVREGNTVQKTFLIE